MDRHATLGCLLGVLFLLPAAAIAAIGRTSGTAAVSPTGAANYTIPLWSPPGSAGMGVPLAIQYDSSRENGLLGMGFALAGFSSVARCEKTIAQDGAAAAVLRVTADGYCLDGQRLRLDSGTYGSAGSVYRTEIESFAKVTATFAGTQGPAVFEARTKDGLILEYGGSTSSRIEFNGSAIVREWALNAVRDRAGNRIDFTYIEDGSPNGGYRPSEITYTANVAAGLSTPPYKIKFFYEAATRPDPVYAHFGGGPANEFKRLERIEVQHNSSIVRQYLFAYTGSFGASGRSRLASVQECAVTTGDCFPATQFTWTNSSASMGSELNPGQAVPSGQFTWHMIDIDADGRDDLVYVSHATSGSGTWRIRKGNSAGGFDTEINTGITNTNYIQAQSLEWDGDGRLDLMVPYASNRWHILRSNGSGFDTPFDTGITVAAGDVTRALDVSGDGRDDLVRLTSSGQARVWVRYRGATNFDASETSLWLAWSPNVTFFTGFSTRPHYFKYRSRIRRAHFDGDSREDFIAILNEFDPESGTNTRYYAGFSGGVFMGALEFSPDLGGNHLWADINGDGLTDILWVTIAGQVRHVLGYNIGLATVNGPSTSGYVASHGVISDYDGDGRDDLAIPYSVGSALHWMRSTGTGIASGVSTGITWSNQIYASANLDGDYYNDLTYLSSTSFLYRVHATSPSDLLDTATDAFGVAADFNYVPMTDATVYTKGTGTTYPLSDFPGPRLLVKQLTATDGTGEGSTYTLSFNYAGAREHLQGRGFAGFASRIVTDGRAGYNVKTEEDYRQDFPYVGLPAAMRLKQSSGTLMREVINSWNALSYSSGTSARSFPYLGTSQSKLYELGGTYNGTHFATVTTTVAAIDSTSGTVTDATATTTEIATGLNPASSKSERIYHSSILNDTTNWCLGRPQTTQLINSHSLTMGATITRTVGRTWDGLMCRPTQEQLEPGDSNWQVTVGLGYDSFGNINSQSVTGIGMSTRTTTMNFGARGQFPETLTNALSQSTAQGFNYDLGVATSVTDPNGLTTSWTRDTFGRLTLETRPDSTSTAWTLFTCFICPSAVRYYVLEEAKNTGGGIFRTDTHYFDQFDRRIYEYRQLHGGGNSATSATFDSRGRLARIYVPYWSGGAHNGYRQFSYDALDRSTTESLYTGGGALDRTTSYAFNGLSVTDTDPKSYVTTRYLTPWGHLARVTDAASGNTDYQYDAFGQLKQVNDAYNNVASSVSYNVRGMKTSQTDLDMGTWTYLPNALGEVTNVRDAKTSAPAWTTIVGYDALGRMTSRQDVPEGVTSNWTWGTSAAAKNIGRLSALSGTGYSESYIYDGVGRSLTTTVNADTSYQFDYTYNNEGTLETLTYPTSDSLRFKLKYTYSYGALLNVRQFTGGVLGTTYWTLNALNDRGQVVDATYGNGVQVITGFDPLTGEIEYRQSGVGGGTSLQNLDYTWDNNGNLTQRRDLRQSTLAENFFYDALDRLDYTTGASSLDFTYDLIGNITNKSDVGSYTYHATKKHAVTAAGSLSFGYDANGNVTSRSGQSVTWYSYNLPNTMNGPSSNSSQFFYTPERARWKQQASYAGTNETTIYVGGLLEKVTRGSNVSWRHLICTPSGTVAQYTRRNFSTPELTHYFTHDHLGSIDSVTNASGGVEVRLSFGAFGQRRGEAGWTGNPTAGDWTKITESTRRGYTTHEHLDNLTLVNMNGRVYDPVIGRFVSSDPFVDGWANSQGFNRYAYVKNNPLSWTDPTGFDGVQAKKQDLGSTQSAGTITVTASRPNSAGTIGVTGNRASVGLAGGGRGPNENGGGGGPNSSHGSEEEEGESDASPPQGEPMQEVTVCGNCRSTPDLPPIQRFNYYGYADPMIFVEFQAITMGGALAVFAAPEVAALATADRVRTTVLIAARLLKDPGARVPVPPRFPPTAPPPITQPYVYPVSPITLP
jgi:RHS repeat-associated protein